MNYLFPNKYKIIGFVVLFAGLFLGVLSIIFNMHPAFFDLSALTIIDQPIGGSMDFFKIVDNNLFDELIAFLIIVGGLLAAFSKEKYEDEFIAKIRLDSLVWAVYSNYLILILAILLMYGMSFFWVLIFNMFTTLLIFLLKFNLKLAKLKRQQT